MSPENNRIAGAETALTPSVPALLRRDGGAAEGEAYPEPDTRFDRLPMQLEVRVKVCGFRVQDLLALDRGSVVETIHEHTQDVPVVCGGALLMWAEFEMAGQKLAVRITRLA
jgi:flagellar motor switch protein FliM